MQRCQQILDKLPDSNLLGQLWDSRQWIAARELPVWLPAPKVTSSGPDEFIAGTIDLLYWSPEARRLVIVDYKTDQPAGEDDLAERIETYRRQGDIYARALQQAWRLEQRPSFELWFLTLDRRIRA